MTTKEQTYSIIKIEDKEKDFDYIIVHKKIINSKTCVADLCKFISCEECPKFDKKINW